MPSILLVVKHAELDRHNAELLKEVAEDVAQDQPLPTKFATLGGDKRRLRGIPALAPGVGGAMAGTLPHIAIEQLDNERRIR